jgi:hypothetical protein
VANHGQHINSQLTFLQEFKYSKMQKIVLFAISTSSTTGSGAETGNGESSGMITEEVIQKTIDSLVRFNLKSIDLIVTANLA